MNSICIWLYYFDYYQCIQKNFFIDEESELLQVIDHSEVEQRLIIYYFIFFIHHIIIDESSWFVGWFVRWFVGSFVRWLVGCSTWPFCCDVDVTWPFSCDWLDPWPVSCDWLQYVTFLLWRGLLTVKYGLWVVTKERIGMKRVQPYVIVGGLN